jgi:hypothetical protein
LKAGEAKNHMLDTFLQALYIAIIYTQRDWTRIAGHLAQHDVFENFRSYGLGSAGDLDIPSIVGVAIKKIISSVCLAEFPFDPWHSWESALIIERRAAEHCGALPKMPREKREELFDKWKQRTLSLTSPKYNFINDLDFAIRYSSTIKRFNGRRAAVYYD